MPSLYEIGSVVLEKKMKLWKVHDNANDNDANDDDDDGQQPNCDQKTSLEPSTQVSLNNYSFIHLHAPICFSFQVIHL